MSQEPTNTNQSEREDPVDRFEHEIEELEKPMGHSIRQWIVGLVAAVVIVGGIFVGSYFANKKTRVAADGADLQHIEIMEPKRGTLSTTPYVFRWDSISGTDRYLVTVQKVGQSGDVISRSTRMSSLELTAEEREKLGGGGAFKWVVQAQTKGGQALAQGGSTFSF